MRAQPWSKARRLRRDAVCRKECQVVGLIETIRAADAGAVRAIAEGRDGDDESGLRVVERWPARIAEARAAGSRVVRQLDVGVRRIALQVQEPRLRLHPGVAPEFEDRMGALQAVPYDLEKVVVAPARILLQIARRRDRRVRAGLRLVELEDAGVVEVERAVVVRRVRERD